MPNHANPSDPRQLIASVVAAELQRDPFSTARFRLVRELRMVTGGNQARVFELIHGALHGWRCAEEEIVRLLSGLYADAGKA